MERSIVRLNRNNRSSLKAGYVMIFYSSVNYFKNDLISTVHQKSYNG